jgi:RNA recognition motif-containing protein
LEPNLPLNVYISNPERKKERTDQDANEKEVYVAGLSRFTTKVDLEKLFSTVWTLLLQLSSSDPTLASQYGPVKDVRIALEDNGQARGFAFIEFEEAVSLLRSHAQTIHSWH